MDIETALGIIGGALGTIAFFWRIWESIMAHVGISVEISPPEENVQKATALITIENDGKLPKKIHYAVLIIGPEGENLRQIVSRLFDDKKTTDDLNPLDKVYKAKLVAPKYSKDGKSAIIPLPYFFVEQKQLGNEKIRYRCSIDLKKLHENQFLTVRLVIFVHYKMIDYLRWRTSSDLLVVNSRKLTF